VAHASQIVKDAVNKPKRMSTIDRYKHDEDLAERMVGGARMERPPRSTTAEPKRTADDHPKAVHPAPTRARNR